MAEDIDMIAFAYDSLMSLRMLKFGLHWSTPYSHNFSQKWPTPGLFEHGDIRWQITMEGWMLEIVQWSQWRAYRKPPRLFQMVPSLTPYDFPCPKLGVPDAPCKTNFVKRAASGGLSTYATYKSFDWLIEYDIRYIQGFFCIQAMLPFAKLLRFIFCPHAVNKTGY